MIADKGGVSWTELKQISEGFGTGLQQVHAVQDIFLSIEKCKVFGIIGFSGAGMSTLIQYINLLEHSAVGTVAVAGQKLTAPPSPDGYSRPTLDSARLC